MGGRALASVATLLIPLTLVRLFDQTEYGTYKQLFLVFATLYSVALVGLSDSLYYFEVSPADEEDSRRPLEPGAGADRHGADSGEAPMMRKERRSGKVRAGAAPGRYLLRLYVTGGTACSLRAIANVKALCEEHLTGSYDLEVLDIYRHPELLREDQIVAVPALVKRLPAPQRLLVGDLSRAERVLAGLGIAPLPS